MWGEGRGGAVLTTVVYKGVSKSCVDLIAWGEKQRNFRLSETLHSNPPLHFVSKKGSPMCASLSLHHQAVTPLQKNLRALHHQPIAPNNVGHTAGVAADRVVVHIAAAPINPTMFGKEGKINL